MEGDTIASPGAYSWRYGLPKFAIVVVFWRNPPEGSPTEQNLSQENWPPNADFSTAKHYRIDLMKKWGDADQDFRDVGKKAWKCLVT